MTLNLYATQQDVLAHAQTVMAPVPVYLTDYPDSENELPGENGVNGPYITLRVNDALRVTSSRVGGAVGGSRYDEMYTLFDFLVASPDPNMSTEIAYGADGVADMMQGYVPVDAGPLERAGGGQVFVVRDGTGARPSNFIARVSFKCLVNMVHDE